MSADSKAKLEMIDGMNQFGDQFMKEKKDKVNRLKVVLYSRHLIMAENGPGVLGRRYVGPHQMFSPSKCCSSIRAQLQRNTF
jgi:hypothetical protein